MKELQQKQGFICDMDGVLYHGNEAIAGGKEFLAFLDAAGVRFLLVTNNSTRTIPQYLHLLAGFGVDHLEPWQILTSAEAVGDYLKARYPAGGPVYVVGETGLVEAVRRIDAARGEACPHPHPPRGCRRGSGAASLRAGSG